MASPNRLIVGLGNPGEEYAGTRHNVGFDVVDRAAEITKTALDTHKGNAVAGSGRYQGRTFTLAKPTSFMNRSGSVVRKLLNKNHLDLDALLVIVDDLNLPFSSIRLRASGGAGGHNGLQDIIDQLGSDKFARLRVGVGSDFDRGGQVDHVLSPFSEDESKRLPEIVDTSARAALTYVSRGINEAMNRFNTRPAAGDS